MLSSTSGTSDIWSLTLSYFIEKPFQNWTRYSSDLIGVVLLYTDYTVPVDKLREEYR
jgi:hypothetical protein